MPDSHDYREHIPIGEVARRLGVSVATVRNWDRDGRLKAIRTPGGQRRFRVTDVDALTEPVAS